MQNDFSSICSRFEYDCTSHGKSVGNFSCPFFPWLMQHGWSRELFFLFSRHGRLIKNTISKGFNLLLLPSFFSSLCKICISIKILCETTHIYYVKDKYFGIFFFYYISFLRPSESLRTRSIPRIINSFFLNFYTKQVINFTIII